MAGFTMHYFSSLIYLIGVLVRIQEYITYTTSASVILGENRAASDVYCFFIHQYQSADTVHDV